MWLAVINSLFTKFPESRHHVNKCCNALAEGVWQVGSEMVAQREKVVGQEHAVVVLDGSQVRKLEQVLPVDSSSRETGGNHLYLQVKCAGLVCYMLFNGNLLTCGMSVQHRRRAGKCFSQ